MFMYVRACVRESVLCALILSHVCYVLSVFVLFDDEL